MTPRPAVAARVMDIRTPTPGWTGEIYVAKGTNGVPKDINGLDGARPRSPARSRATGSSSTPAGNRYRYYLVWITKLPPGADRVKISEIRLYR